MGILNKTRCYLIGAMEYADGAPWREFIEKQLADLNITFFNPYYKPFENAASEGHEVREDMKTLMKAGRYDAVSDHMREVRCEDLRLCDISDWFIAYIDPKIPSWGSSEEICTANREKKITFLVVEGGKQNTPSWLMGTIPHEFIYGSFDELMENLRKIDSGEKKIESKRWRLLKPEYR